MGPKRRKHGPKTPPTKPSETNDPTEKTHEKTKNIPDDPFQPSKKCLLI